MDEQEKREASVHAARAAEQAKHAAKNAGRAAKDIADPLLADAAEELRDTGEKLEGTAQDAAKAAKRLNPGGLAALTGNTGQGFLALSVALYASAIAYSKFRGVYLERGRALKTPTTRVVVTQP